MGFSCVELCADKWFADADDWLASSTQLPLRLFHASRTRYSRELSGFPERSANESRRHRRINWNQRVLDRSINWKRELIKSGDDSKLSSRHARTGRRQHRLAELTPINSIELPVETLEMVESRASTLDEASDFQLMQSLRSEASLQKKNQICSFRMF